ncbi:saccharopine dehydrogenase [Vreelandella nigrificans]|uniref:Saccharopine dehydrogenase n=1 Tax=Vreelandella nigrificans TaxID=2042704 RepID=A0A2A4HIJ2_9GAMM|nr:saccharopine dehydrogenase [Halomonas nigrificans]PCF93903.1 saccharopine dehydrogenase [Halomonas nigrificans]
MPITHKPVLIIGGSGVVGSQAAHTLRRLQPQLPIAIGGRDLAKAEAVAAKVGGAHGVAVNLERADLGLAESDKYSAVAIFLKDETLNSMRFAQKRGLPYISVSSGTFEQGPEVSRFVHHPGDAPILMASHWLAGAAIFPVLHFAKAYRALETIHIGVLLDKEDMGGPAASADYERITGVAPAALTLRDGNFTWVSGAEAEGRFTSVDGTPVAAQAYSPFDIMGLAAATDASAIRLDFALGESASRRRGEPFSTEIVIELRGLSEDGAPRRSRHEIVHPAGQAPLTALGVALGVERLLGLAGGSPVAPGLYLPEVIIEPDYFVERLLEFGARIESPEELVS